MFHEGSHSAVNVVPPNVEFGHEAGRVRYQGKAYGHSEKRPEWDDTEG